MLYVDDMTFTEIHRLLGVDIDRAHGPAIWDALEDVQSILEERWADGGSLAMVDRPNVPRPKPSSPTSRR